MSHPHDEVRQALRAFGLTFPGTSLRAPWPEHLDLAVNDKTFAFLNVDGTPLRVSCKLPESAAAALALPFTTPTPYGLGKRGWVTAEFGQTTEPPLDLLRDWVAESYLAIAPKRLVRAVLAR